MNKGSMAIAKKPIREYTSRINTQLNVPYKEANREQAMNDKGIVKIRRQPEQTRSRERVDAVLQATRELITELGNEPVSMTNIASRAGMAVTALYRYFPNKQAVLRELATQTLDSDREALTKQVLDSSLSLADVTRTISLAYWKLHQQQPFRLALRNAIQADAELMKLDLADTRVYARVLGEHFVKNGFAGSLKEAEKTILMNIIFLDAAIRLCSQVSRAEAKVLMEHCITMSIRQAKLIEVKK